MRGSGGPTLIDSDTWRHILNCKSYSRESQNLAEAISGIAKILCTEKVHPCCLKEFSAGRLVPLDKGADSEGNPGVRPIGIGEILRRIIGKCVVSLLKSDIQHAAGCLQMCTGIRSGIEAAVHMNERAWADPSTEAVLLVDADNAFNRLNRKVALHNIQQICPPIYTYLFNHYQAPSDLIVAGTFDSDFDLNSEEGCTQGDVAAMAFYGLGVQPLVDKLSSLCNYPQYCKQSWYADDSASKWWDLLISVGPKYMGTSPSQIKLSLC